MSAEAREDLEGAPEWSPRVSAEECVRSSQETRYIWPPPRCRLLSEKP